MATENKKMQQRRDTAANWTANNPTLSAGEIGFETNTGKFKIGDGATAWNSLAYAAIPASGAIDLGGATSFEIPNSAAPTVNADGEIALDTTVTDFSHGIVKYYGGEEMAVVALPIAALTTPTNGHVIKYNSTNDEFELGAAGGGTIDGSGTANTLTMWSDADTIGNAAGLTKETDETLRVTMQAATEAFVIREHASQSVGPFRIEASDGTDKISLTRDGGGYRMLFSGSASYIGMGDVSFGQSDGLTNNAIIGYNTAGAVKIRDNASVVNLQVDSNATAGNTRMLVYDVDNATLERVSVGAADSGGTGYKVLRIPN